MNFRNYGKRIITLVLVVCMLIGLVPGNTTEVYAVEQQVETDDLQQVENDDLQESETDELLQVETDDLQESETDELQQVEINDIDLFALSQAEIADLPKPGGYEKVTLTSQSTIESGTYLIIHDNRVMTNVSGQNGNDKGFISEGITIQNNKIASSYPAYEWTFTRLSNGTYNISNSSGQYLNLSASGGDYNTFVSDTKKTIYTNISNGQVELYVNNNGNNIAVNYYASEGLIFSGWREGTGDPNNMHILYKKVSDTKLNVAALYSLILEANAYENTNGRYGTSEYDALQSVLEESAEIYRNAFNANTTVTQNDIDNQVEALRQAIENLVASVGYIEVPIEVLDFRADGVMFEYDSGNPTRNLYELLTEPRTGSLTYGNVVVPMPGENVAGLTANSRRKGLVEDYLVDGAPVYKEATVDYIAKLMANGVWGDSFTSGIANRNNTISGKIEELSKYYNSSSDTNSMLGTWEQTLAKTSTKANGGKLTWDQVETCYDLAYYALNNMWRSVENADGDDTYNMVVPERTNVRLQKGEDGYYTLDSSKAISYDGDYIYNTNLSADNGDTVKFAPVDDLGYESPSEYNDTTDSTSGVNFHFTMNMRGAFVYNADDNLYFYFDGDDDVFFYVNGHLVMEIGGGHSHSDDELYLNTIADQIGLVDGGIYTFDMFYAERHTTAANLVFKTNIKIMDTMSITSKEQYNATTGQPIAYGSIVAANTIVAYNFGLLNLRSIPVYDICFKDDTLGTNISNEGITLYDAAKTNGVDTYIEDMIVYYHTYDRPSPTEEGVLNNAVPIEKTVAEIIDLLNAAKTNSVSLASGSYKVQITSEDELKTLLHIGIPIDTQICVYGVKRKVTDLDRPYINTVTSNASYDSNGRTVSLNGIANQKLTVLNSFRIPVDNEQIVIDYGKPIQIDISKITENIILNSNVTAEFYGITFNGSHNQIRTSVDNVITALDKEYDATASAGKVYLRGADNSATAIEFQLKEMLSRVEKGYAVYKITDSALTGTAYATYYLFIEVDIIPATNVYYETDFADGVFELETTSKIDDEKWRGPMDSGNPNERNAEFQDSYYKFPREIYGYDSSYENDSLYSNGSSLSVIGQGIKASYNPDNYTEARFSFTGTGFDIISRTGAEEGAIRVDVYSDAARTQREKSVTVLNKSESNLELYQIPVVSVENLNHGTHYVTISVNAAYTNTDYPALSRGASFYFDAVRIYDPIDASAALNAAGDELMAYKAYSADGEANEVITEVRNNLIAADDYNVAVETPGMAFVDRGQESVDISTYETIGPNNEVYLTSANQAIAFKIKATGMPVSVDIGAKSADGQPVTMVTKIVPSIDAADAGIQRTIDITTSTARFYDLADEKDPASVFNEDGEAYVFISNTESGILSITDIKIAYGNDVIPLDVTYQVDSDVAEGAKKFLLSLPIEDTKEEVVPSEYDIISVEFDRKTGYIFKDAALKIKTSQSVEQLKVTSYMRWETLDNSSYVDTADGYRMWTIDIVPFVLDSQTYKVIGYGEDGTVGAPMSAALNVKWK